MLPQTLPSALPAPVTASGYAGLDPRRPSKLEHADFVGNENVSRTNQERPRQERDRAPERDKVTRKDYPRYVRCYLCSFQIDTELTDQRHPLFGTIDHIIPKSAGGKNNASNRAPAHKLCNGMKGARLLSDEVIEECTLAAAKMLTKLGIPETKRWKADRAKAIFILKSKGES